MICLIGYCYIGTFREVRDRARRRMVVHQKQRVKVHPIETAERHEPEHVVKAEVLYDAEEHHVMHRVEVTVAPMMYLVHVHVLEEHALCGLPEEHEK